MDAESDSLCQQVSSNASGRRGRRRGRPSRGATGGRASTRGIGRGRVHQAQVEREAAAAAILSQKKEQMKEMVTGLPEVEVREVLIDAIEKDPYLFYEILERRSQQSVQECPDPQPSSTNSLDWCSRTFCRDMLCEEEKVCCEKQPDICISSLANFQLLMLDEEVLDIARLYRQDMLAFPAEDDQNRGRRHAAYRQFTLWKHGRLGAGNRLVIPSCCVWRIRDKFPDRFEQYTGFLPGRLG